jgi:iron complex transport system substrate-binding protein
VSSYDDDPPEVKTLPRVGALLDPDTERILALKPDLVLVYGSQAELADQLQRAAIPLFSYRHGGLASLSPTFRRLGELTGHLAEAARVIAAIERRLTEVRLRVAGRKRPRTLVVLYREPMSLRQLDASGGVGFLNDVIETAGGANVFADVKREAVRVSTEMLLARAPEVIVDLHYSGAIPEAQLQRERDIWQPLASIPAVKTNRVHILVGDHLVVPGPRIAQAAEDYARAIHPDAFR